MAHEFALLQPFQATGAIPGALIVGKEEVAGRIEVDAARRASAAAPGSDFAVVRNTQTPATKLDIAGEGASQAQRDVHVAVFVELGPKGVFVIVAGDFPWIGNRFEDVGRAVALAVLDARHFGAMRDI